MATRNRSPEAAAVLAGALYALAVFACGFALGTLRVLALAPAVGELFAVLIEMPIMLAIAWLICSPLVGRMAPPPKRAARALMGVSAFVGLIVLELLVSVVLFAGTPGDMIEGWLSPAGALGLAGQMAFAAFPLFVAAGDAKR